MDLKNLNKAETISWISTLVLIERCNKKCCSPVAKILDALKAEELSQWDNLKKNNEPLVIDVLEAIRNFFIK